MDDILYEDTDRTVMKTTSDHGRGIYATKVLEPGSTILKEQPYACAIMAQYRSIVCDNCSSIYEPPKEKKKLGADGLPVQNKSGNKSGTSGVQNKSGTQLEETLNTSESEPLKRAKTMKKCSACKLQYYCCSDCQKKHWHKIHKYECKILKAHTELPENHHAFLVFRTMLKVAKGLDEVRDKQIIDLEPNYDCQKKLEKEVKQCYEFCMKSEIMKEHLNGLIKRYQFDDPMHIILEFSARLINNRMALVGLGGHFLYAAHITGL